MLSAKRRQHFPEWTILSNVDGLIQGEVTLEFRSCWIVFIHVVRGRPGGLLQFSDEEAVKIFLASVLSSIRAMWPSRQRRRACTIAKRCD